MHNHKILYLLGLFILYMQEWALKPFGTFPPDYNLVVSLLYILLGFWWYRDEKLCSFSQFGPTVNAARGIAVQVQGVVYKFVQSYLQAVNPQITKLYASGEIKKMHNLISLSAKFSYFVMLIISVPLIMEMKPILSLWLGNYPDYTIVFCDLTICILMLETIAYPFLVGSAANGVIKKYYTVTGLILISMLPISYVALKLGIDPIGVYIIQLLISVIVMCWRVGKGANLINYPMHLLYNEIFKPVFNVTSLVFILIISFKFLEKSEPISYMLVTIICFVSFLITNSIIYIFGMKNSERDYLKGRIKSVIEKVK